MLIINVQLLFRSTGISVMISFSIVIVIVWPARRHRRRHRRQDPNWIQQRGSQASVQVCGQHCAGRWGAGQGAPEEVVLSRAGLQIPQGKYVLLQEGGAGLQAQVL